MKDKENELKAELFDILVTQEHLRNLFNQKEQLKQEKLKELQSLQNPLESKEELKEGE